MIYFILYILTPGYFNISIHFNITIHVSVFVQTIPTINMKVLIELAIIFIIIVDSYSPIMTLSKHLHSFMLMP